MTIIECLKKRQAESGLSIRKYCESIDLLDSQYHIYTKGKGNPSSEKLKWLKEVLKYDEHEKAASISALSDFQAFEKVLITHNKELKNPITKLIYNEYKSLLDRYRDGIEKIKIKPRN